MANEETFNLALEALQDPLSPTKRLNAITALLKAIAEEDKQEQGEPVGVMCINCGSSWSNERLAKEKEKNADFILCCPERKMVNVYTHPQPKREPLTDANWMWAWLMDWCKQNKTSPANHDSLFKMVSDARAIEAAHGIKE
jgi:hypothetical protein